MTRLLSLVLLLAAFPASTWADAPQTSAISKEPLYAGLVSSAGRLRAQTETFAAKPSLALLTKAGFKTYAQNIRALSDGDLKGHYDLRARGTDNDLKCILMGVSRDLGIKMTAIEAAKSDAELGTALGNMRDLLSDNIDVIVTPESADSGLDCVIEFGKGA